MAAPALILLSLFRCSTVFKLAYSQSGGVSANLDFLIVVLFRHSQHMVGAHFGSTGRLQESPYDTSHRCDLRCVQSDVLAWRLQGFRRLMHIYLFANELTSCFRVVLLTARMP
jgi:hypothetical protein